MKFIRLAISTVSLIALGSAAFAQTTPLSKADVAAIVKETIMENPEIIMQAIEKLRADKAEQAKKESAAALEKLGAEVFNNPAIPGYGASAKDADVTLVEFFDYHCGYCKHFLPELTKLVDADKKVRVLFVDFPILSEDSVTAAKAAIAVNRIDKDKYFEFHSALMKESGKFDEAKLLEVGKKIGIKSDVLKTEMNNPEVAAIVEKNRDIANKLGISGTPAIIIGKEIIPGATSADELKKMVAAARAKK